MPTLSFSPAAPAAVTAYCRQARRLRARFGGDPARLQFALRDLATTADRRPRFVPSVDPVERIAPTPQLLPGPARLFSSRVEGALTGGILRYSDRKDLLREAARMGIDRFQATLLIAAVQHGEGRASQSTSYTLSPSKRPFPAATVLTAVTLQGLIAATVWWVMHT